MIININLKCKYNKLIRNYKIHKMTYNKRQKQLINRKRKLLNLIKE